MVEPQPSKLAMPVRSWSSAPSITAAQRLVKEVEAVEGRGAITLHPAKIPRLVYCVARTASYRRAKWELSTWRRSKSFRPSCGLVPQYVRDVCASQVGVTQVGSS